MRVSLIFMLSLISLISSFTYPIIHCIYILTPEKNSTTVSQIKRIILYGDCHTNQFPEKDKEQFDTFLTCLQQCNDEKLSTDIYLEVPAIVRTIGEPNPYMMGSKHIIDSYDYDYVRAVNVELRCASGIASTIFENGTMFPRYRFAIGDRGYWVDELTMQDVYKEYDRYYQVVNQFLQRATDERIKYAFKKRLTSVQSCFKQLQDMYDNEINFNDLENTTLLVLVKQFGEKERKDIGRKIKRVFSKLFDVHACMHILQGQDCHTIMAVTGSWHTMRLAVMLGEMGYNIQSVYRNMGSYYTIADSKQIEQSFVK